MSKNKFPASSLLVELGYSYQPGADNWYITEKALSAQFPQVTLPHTDVNQESIADSVPPAMFLAPKVSETATRRLSVSQGTSSKESKSTLGIRISNKESAAMLLFEKMKDEEK